jgi:predicted lipoprotein with Yx(FWY)xxD motif
MFKLKNLFIVLVALLVASPVFAQATATTVSLGKTDALGTFLVGKDGLTLYVFTPDPLNESVCTDKCAEAWPPLTVDSADKLTVADGIPGDFATITRKDGSLQVTYNGLPLYYWFKDAKAGDTTGHRVARTWWVVPPATVYGAPDAKLGTVLVGPKGMTLYKYTQDGPNSSACSGKCATNWPPLTVKSADELVPGVNLRGKFDTIKRDDGSLQVTYNGAPLYYYAKDKARGDSTGEEVGEKWYTIVPETVGVAKAGDADALVSMDGMTLYTYAKDTAGTSTCTGDCLKAWTPFTVGLLERVNAGAGAGGKLATIKFNDDSLQVTYNGAPLYLAKSDKKPGDATAASGDWATVKP